MIKLFMMTSYRHLSKRLFFSFGMIICIIHSMNEPAAIASPCIKICVINENTEQCEGCFRTRDEIAQWKMADDAFKRALLETLEIRKQSV